jgi:FO synthase
MRRRVTFSRNITLSLSRTCRCFCKYCAFKTHRAHLHEPGEVLELLDAAARRNVKELLVLTGERPEVHPEVAERLAAWGHPDFVSYVAWACARALERGLLPHTNLGVLDRDDLARLREVTASQGLMLESVVTDLVAHQGSPTKHPDRRLQTIRWAGELRIPFTSGILVGIGERHPDRVAALEALAAVHAEHGHLQEVILQNFVPHQAYYGREVADVATRRRGASGAPASASARSSTSPPGPPASRWPRWRTWSPRPGACCPGSASGAPEPGRLVARARGRRRHRPRRAERQRRPHLARAPVPVPHQVRKRLAAEGVALTERLCAYPRYLDAEWLDQGVLDVVKARYWSFIPRRGSGRQEPPFAIRAELVGPAVEKARHGGRLSAERSPRCSARRGPRRWRPCVSRPTSCAPSWRGRR